MKPDTGVSSSSGRPVRLLDQERAAIRVRHCSIRTEQAYVHWGAGFIRVSGMRHPRDMGARGSEPAGLADGGSTAIFLPVALYFLRAVARMQG